MDSFLPAVIDTLSDFISLSPINPPDMTETDIKIGGKDVKNPIWNEMKLNEQLRIFLSPNSDSFSNLQYYEVF